MTQLPWNKIFGGAMLVAGTCIGAGMLGLPVSTAASGFFPSSIAFLFCWIMMTISAFLMLEVSLWQPAETNLITMAKTTLGRPGEVVAWITYILFLYAIMTAYTTGSVGMINSVLGKFGVNESWGIWIVVLIFGTVVYCGARSVDWVNRLLMLGLVVSYIALIANVIPKVSLEMLGDGQPKYLWTIGPLLVTSFGFHLLIPSLKNYLNGDVKSLRIAIFLGSLLPLIVYLFWEVLILGVIPVHGQQGLVAILYAEHTEGTQAIVELPRLLSHLLNNPHVTYLAKCFGLCALLTSFIGVALGLFDFLADGFHIKKSRSGKLILSTITFIPPIILAIFYPRFMLALRYAGIFAAILLVIFPAMMVWSGRYRLKTASGFYVYGGKIVLLLVFLFGIGVIGLEVLHHLNFLPTPLAEKHLFE
ncbi:MAG: amino acid permease [Candidatus Berkiellales bacterium]